MNLESFYIFNSQFCTQEGEVNHGKKLVFGSNFVCVKNDNL